MRKKIEPKINEDELRRIVAICTCKRDVIRQLHLNSFSGHHYRIVSRLLKKFNISIDHFSGSGWSKAKHTKRRPLSEILVANSTYTNTNRLRQRLIREKIFEERCCNCKNTEWMGRKIPLELEHKNIN